MPGSLTLSKLAFKAGARPGATPLELAPPTVTVIVGPNGSGKSQTLSEIDAWASGGNAPGDLLEAIDANWPTYEEARALLAPYEQTVFPVGTTRPPAGQFRVAPAGILGGHQADISEEGLQQALDPARLSDAGYDPYRRNQLLNFFKVRLTGRERHALASDQQLGDISRPQTHLAVLFASDSLRARVSELVHSAFDMFFTLDPTSPVGQVRIKLNSHAPPSEEVERGLNAAAVAYHSAGLPLTSQSDGVQAFTGLVAGVFALPHRTILVDEPEAFLPPPLARRLGGAIAGVGRERDATIVAATHSAAFLMGCIDSGADTTIVRLTYERPTGTATARQLTTAELRPLMYEPLLRSTRALEGLFHRAVVVGESDADRAFYDEINRRLVDGGRGIADAQFVNAQNWQTEPRVFGPLRKLGVPAVAILDIDTLWGKAVEWRRFYTAVGLVDSDADWNRLEAQRKAVTDPQDRSKAKSGGTAAMPSTRRSAMRSLIKDLAEYGIFVVPVGELESWLPGLGVTKKSKHAWIVGLFSKLGSDPARTGYVHPATGDVWAFLDQINRWVADPNKKGMP